jgi:hypothetical protein
MEIDDSEGWCSYCGNPDINDKIEEDDDIIQD